MAELRLVDRVDVKFQGERGGDGPLTFGQSNTLQWVVISEMEQSIQSMLPWVFDVPDRTRFEDVAEVLSIVLARNESLRTTYHAEAGSSFQRVAESGALTVDVYHCAQYGDAETRDLVGLMRDRPFDLAQDLHVRVAVVMGSGDADGGNGNGNGAPDESGFVSAVIAMYTHMAVDFGALAVINEQFVELIADPAARHVGPLAHQPLDQAAFERSERGQRQNDRAMRYWSEQLRIRPQCQFPMTAAPEPKPLSGLLLAREVTQALPRIMERTGASAPTVTLAAMFAVLAGRTGQRHIVFSSLSNNRSGRLREYVGTLAQDSLVLVDADAESFDELVRRMSTAILKANRHSLYDPHSLEPMAIDIEWERGMRSARDCAFNNLSAHEVSEGTLKLHSAQISSARESGSLGWKEPDFDPVALRFAMVKWAGQILLDISTGHTGWLPAAEIESLLGALQQLVAAAADQDVELAQLAEITGIKTIHRDTDWHIVDNSWIQQSAVQALLDHALPASSAHAIVGADATVTAYLRRTDAVPTPKAAHTACMVSLRAHPTAVAPTYYVLADEAPTDPAAWPQQSVRAEGDGRK
ncbi:hypothetical protein KDL01_28195 [Actinospica durhamensis]|uniref:Condensation domain-containing protein n=1 Tax=Actinospica durhamensis TaxID=1508375 RepID=A0A941IVH0_9ACTN|nr:condensation domain-containing protein [Actinospica durhamensis]MBR7837191.1 hypothetical protein [Actinospica durhamensis]